MIPAIVLAAGRSSRMGRPKALLPLGAGETFLSRIVGTLRSAGVEEIVVVAGADAAPIRAAVAERALPARVVENPDCERGQLSSLLVGIAEVERPDVRAAIVTLIDVPLVSAATVRRMLEAYEAGSAQIVRPARGAQHGHPVVFDRVLFDEFRRADPREGAKGVVRRHSPLNVEVDDPGAFVDIDTPDDYARWVGPL